MAPIDRISDALRKAFEDAIKGSQSTLDQAASEAGKDIGPAMQGVFSGGFSLDDLLLLVPGVGELLTLPGLAMGKLIGKAGEWVLGIASGWALGSFFTEAIHPFSLEVIHAINDALQSEIFDPETAAKLQAQGIINNAFGRSEAAGGNLSGEHFDKLVDMTQTRPDVASLLEMLNREEVDETEVRKALTRHTIPDFWHDKIISMRRQLLSPADLALAVLRGNIDDITMRGYAKQLGVTDADMQVLTENTGEPPGPQELAEAFRRGYVDEAEFTHGIRQSRIRNEWIPTLLKLRYSPMSVAEAARAVVENYLTHDEGESIAQQNGLLPEHWPIIVESWGRPLSHEQMLTLHYRGQATLDEVRQAMRESDVKNKYIEQAIELGRHLIPERTIVSMLDHGAITHEEALTKLLEHGFSEQDAELLVKLGAAQRTSSHRGLTRTDILAMYSDSLLKRVEARDQLMKLGYSETDATEILDLTDVKSKTRILKTLQAGVEASFKAGHLTEQQALNELEHAGIDHQQAQMLLDEWKLLKGRPTRSLTEAQILKLGEDKIISPADTLARLEGLGLIESDAQLLMRLHGIGQQGA